MKSKASSSVPIYILHSHMLFSTGGTRFIYEIAGKLATKRPVTIVVERASKYWKKKYEDLSINCIELEGLTSNSEKYWLFFPVILCVNYFKIRRLLGNKKVIVLSFLFPMNFIAAFLPYKHIHYCFEPFAFFYDRSLQKSFPPIKQLFLRVLAFILSPLDTLGVKKANRVLAINPSVGQYVKKIYHRSPDSYSYLGVDIKHFRPVKVKRESFTTIFHSTDFTPLKGTEYLIKALCQLETEYAEKLKVYVSESLTNDVAKNALVATLKKFHREKQVTFLSHLAYADLPKYYSMSSAYYFVGDPASTGATAASLSVLEAQACGTPVVRSIGNSDEVVPKATGFLVDPRNTAQLVTYLKLQVLKPRLFSDMRKAARQHVVSKYTWDKVAERIESEIALL